jgi:thioredoxin-dependent peroxiredoxin
MGRKITYKGNPLTLVGRSIQKGGRAPDFKVVSLDAQEISLSGFAGKTKVITFFPSIDTPVCDLQVKEFNKRAADFSSGVVVLAISKDLPFAQKRFCSANEIHNLTVLSDYKTSSFGINYGLLIKELNLLARGVLLVDKNGFIRYLQVVDELTAAPDYEDALRNLEDIVKNPQLPVKDEAPGHCKPCEKGTPPMDRAVVEKLLAQHRNWGLIEDKKISKEFKFQDFPDAKYFLDLVAIIAEEQGHHPVMTISYNKVKITLTTHAAGGLTENDFIMARIIDEL